MTNPKSSATVIGTGVLSALAASICCITPVIALLAGSSSIAANFSWIEPARPYLIGLSIAVLGFAWYQQLKPVKNNPDDCHCDTGKKSFFQSRLLLFIVTVFSILMMTFPLYARIFYSNPDAKIATGIATPDKKQTTFSIRGMSCQSCEGEINNELSKLQGVVAYSTSYGKGTSVVTYDPSKVSDKTIISAINKTGYVVTGSVAVTQEPKK
ncbi:mercuric transport protein MerTP [Sediminibacterium roseum]|uniref:Mercuric transport protein MerT n=1 Tax=Sediminibacterium roseum TaxID=1978412 RepID=A0ABW9ZQX4_9BACT|nr:mercuric transport protein MerTP [Sediminibacterium roseum]NCI49329.1 mercuric transport protein MerTP [Sediminibacterium roseum]TAJ60633.1 MAG: mercuric transport protein MerTP [Chitinophagaceae bacterium]